MNEIQHRRRFLGAMAAAAAPAILGAADKAGSKRPIMGSEEHTYEVFHDWGELPAGLRYGNTHGVCQDMQGRIYIAHTVHASSQMEHTVAVFDEKGKFIRSWGSEFKGGAHGLHVRKEGAQEFLYFVDTGKGRSSGVDPRHTWMVKMTLTGEEVFRIGYPKESPYYKLDAEGKPATKFSPTNVAIAPEWRYLRSGRLRLVLHQPIQFEGRVYSQLRRRGERTGAAIEPARLDPR